MPVIWVGRQEEYFPQRGWTDFWVICPSGGRVLREAGKDAIDDGQHAVCQRHCKPTGRTNESPTGVDTIPRRGNIRDSIFGPKRTMALPNPSLESSLGNLRKQRTQFTDSTIEQ
jgi:hypothetical protein